MRARLMALIAVAAAAGPAGMAGADPLWDMCNGPGNRGPEQCDCVVGTLRAEFGPDLALYEALAVRYLAEVAAGKAQPQAWELAMQKESAARAANYPTFAARANALAERHAAINRQCGGG